MISNYVLYITNVLILSEKQINVLSILFVLQVQRQQHLYINSHEVIVFKKK